MRMEAGLGGAGVGDEANEEEQRIRFYGINIYADTYCFSPDYTDSLLLTSILEK